MKHVTLFLLALCLSLAGPVRAQQLYAAPQPLSDYTQLIDSLTQYLDKSRVPTGILYDRALGLSGLSTFAPGQTSSSAQFRQSYYDLWTAAYAPPARHAVAPHAG